VLAVPLGTTRQGCTATMSGSGARLKKLSIKLATLNSPSTVDGSLLFNDFNFPPCMPMNFQEAEIMECTYSLAVQLKYDCEACRSDPLP